MAGESATALIERLKSDLDFARRILAVADPAERLMLIGEEGYDIKPGDIEAMGRELEEAEFNHIVGGTGCDPVLPEF